mgnify:CR=1 FL=1
MFVLVDRFKLLPHSSQGGYTEYRQKGSQNIERLLVCLLISLFDLLNTLAIASVANAQMIAKNSEQWQIRPQHRRYLIWL